MCWRNTAFTWKNLSINLETSINTKISLNTYDELLYYNKILFIENYNKHLISRKKDYIQGLIIEKEMNVRIKWSI